MTNPKDPYASEPQHTYTSTQATNCAGCGKHKHTPLRIDKMGGYVCLTCIDKELGSLLGEFGYPLPVQGWKLAPYVLTPEMSHIVETEMEGRDFAVFWRDLLNAAPFPATEDSSVAEPRKCEHCGDALIPVGRTQLAPVRGQTAPVPNGWKLEKNANGTITINCPIGGAVVSALPDADRRIPESILHSLASAMLEAEHGIKDTP